MKLEMEVTTEGLHQRTGPAMTYPSKGQLAKGSKHFATAMQSGWYKLGTYWSSGSHLKIIKDHETGTVSPIAKTNTSATSTTPNNAVKDALVKLDSKQMAEYSIPINISVGTFKEVRTIFGLPHKFTRTTDVTIEGLNYGRKYAESIIADMPFLQLSPGKPDFLTGLDSGSKNGMVKAMTGADNRPGMIDEILNGKNARYYTFSYISDEYFKYVNTICQMSAVYLGIGDVEYNGSRLRFYNWANYQNGLVIDFGGAPGSVAFFVDASSSMNESLSNDTSKSILDSGLDAVSDAAKEAQFLFGAGGIKIDALSTQNYEEDITNVAKKLGQDPNSLLKKLSGAGSTILKGGNLVFPEIWKDSSFNKNYDISLKLISPYGDKLSVYLNIFVPFFHLLTMALPRAFTANGIISPYLVRAFAKGWLNCDMGIIDSFSFKKGGDGDSWSIDGLPLELDISFSIKDMYNSLAMSNSSHGSLLYGNIGMIDFISSFSGININKPEFGRKLNMVFSMNSAKYINTPVNLYNKIERKIYNSIRDQFYF